MLSATWHTPPLASLVLGSPRASLPSPGKPLGAASGIWAQPHTLPGDSGSALGGELPVPKLCGLSCYAADTLLTAPTEQEDVKEAWESVMDTVGEQDRKSNPWRAQQSHAVRWERYISMLAKPGTQKISTLQEKIAQ